MRLRAHDVWGRLAIVLATGFGIGYARVMPGTFGSLLGIPLAWLLSQAQWPLFLELTVMAAIVLAGVPICGRAARHFGRRDPGTVVYDEIAALPLVFLPTRLTFTTVLLGFVWFRVFDIAKPWPVRRMERLAGGLGIVMDDVAAAAYAAAALWLSVMGLDALRR